MLLLLLPLLLSAVHPDSAPAIMHTHQMVDFRAHFGMLAQELLCVFTSLPDTGFLIGIPRAALVYDIHICRQIQNIPSLEMPLP